MMKLDKLYPVLLLYVGVCCCTILIGATTSILRNITQTCSQKRIPESRRNWLALQTDGQWRGCLVQGFFCLEVRDCVQDWVLGNENLVLTVCSWWRAMLAVERVNVSRTLHGKNCRLNSYAWLFIPWQRIWWGGSEPLIGGKARDKSACCILCDCCCWNKRKDHKVLSIFKLFVTKDTYRSASSGLSFSRGKRTPDFLYP